jgi:hypothetical protein
MRSASWGREQSSEGVSVQAWGFVGVPQGEAVVGRIEVFFVVVAGLENIVVGGGFVAVVAGFANIVVVEVAAAVVAAVAGAPAGVVYFVD